MVYIFAHRDEHYAFMVSHNFVGPMFMYSIWGEWLLIVGLFFSTLFTMEDGIVLGRLRRSFDAD